MGGVIWEGSSSENRKFAKIILIGPHRHSCQQERKKALGDRQGKREKNVVQRERRGDFAALRQGSSKWK